jgi:hypothetical protein
MSFFRIAPPIYPLLRISSTSLVQLARSVPSPSHGAGWAGIRARDFSRVFSGTPLALPGYRRADWPRAAQEAGSTPQKGTTMPVKMKDVYAITERGEGAKALWSRIGVAFVNKDDSLNVILDAFPLSGKINIRDRDPSYGSKPKQEEAA